jgi:hypothetical protein
MKKKKLPNKLKRKHNEKVTLDCYGIDLRNKSCKVGKITTSKVLPKSRADWDGHL